MSYIAWSSLASFERKHFLSICSHSAVFMHILHILESGTHNPMAIDVACDMVMRDYLGQVYKSLIIYELNGHGSITNGNCGLNWGYHCLCWTNIGKTMWEMLNGETGDPLKPMVNPKLTRQWVMVISYPNMNFSQHPSKKRCLGPNSSGIFCQNQQTTVKPSHLVGRSIHGSCLAICFLPSQNWCLADDGRLQVQ